MLVIDGSYGEGGGQVLRTSLALSAVTGKVVRIEGVRAGRRKPGLQPQHLTGVRAAAKICNAKVSGARLNSLSLVFEPQSEPKAGRYTFDVAQVAKGGSAGSVGLILQTVLVPLLLAPGTSHLVIRGGTHVAWSPCHDYLKRVYLPTLARLGVQAKSNIQKWGWYPIGGGTIEAVIRGSEAGSQGPGPSHTTDVGFAEGRRTERPAGRQPGWRSIDLRRRGGLLRVRGVSASSNLPKHIRVRQEAAALQHLRAHGANARIEVIDAPAKGMGTVVFLWAECENATAGFTSLGERGKPAERVAQEAAQELLEYLEAEAALDRYLADQLLLPLALTPGTSCFTTQAVTRHLLTNAWVINQFYPGLVQVEGEIRHDAVGAPATCWIGR